MKKLLLIIVSVTIILSSMGGFVYAADNTVTDNELYNNAYELFSALKIAPWGEDIDTTKAISRNEFANAVVMLMQADRNAAEKIYFNDVRVKDSGNVLAAYGYVDVGKKSFNGSDILQYTDAIKIACNITSWNKYANAIGGRDADYIAVARKNSFDIGIKSRKSLTYADALILLYNAAKAGNVEIRGYSTDGMTQYETGKSILEALYKVYFYKGSVNANSYVSLYTNVSKTSDKQVLIGDRILEDENYIASNMIGQYIEGYYQKDNERKNGTILTAIPVKGTNDEICLMGEDVLSGTSNSLEYVDEIGSRKSLRVLNPLIILNGEAIFDSRYNFKDYINTLKSCNGQIRLYKNNNSAYSVIVCDSYVYGTVNSVSQDTLYFEDRAGMNIGLNYIEAEYCRITNTTDNANALFEDLKNGDVIAAAFSTDKKYICVYKCDKVVSGKIETLHSGKNQYVTIDKQKYLVEAGFANMPDNGIKLGSTVAVALDIFDRIVHCQVNNDDYIVGYVYARGVEKRLFDEDEIVYKIFTSENKKEILKLKKKVILDGTSDILCSVADAQLLDGGELKPQIIRFKKNLSGYITEIDTAAESGDGLIKVKLPDVNETDKTILKENSTLKYYATTAFNRYYLSATGLNKEDASFDLNTRIMMSVNPSKNPSLEMYERNFSTYVGVPKLTSSQTYSVEVYKYDENNKFADLILCYSSDGAGFRTTEYIVNEMRSTLDKENNACVSLTLLPITVGNYTTEELCLESELKILSQSKVHTSINDNEIGQFITEGDVVRVSVNAIGKIDYIRLIFDYDERQTEWGWTSTSAPIYNSLKGKYEYRGTYEYKYESIPFSDSSIDSKGRYVYAGVADIFNKLDMASIVKNKTMAYVKKLDDNGNAVGDVVETLKLTDSYTVRYAFYDNTRGQQYQKTYHGVISDISCAEAGGEYDRVLYKIGTSGAVTSIVFYKNFATDFVGAE